MPTGAGSAFTDEKGRFTFRDLASGKYRVFAIVGNLIRTNVAVVEVSAEKPAFAELRIQPVTPFVRGQVVSTEGAPIANAKISLVMAEGWNAEFEAQTDADGKFELHNMPAGVYYIVAEARDWAKVFAGKFNFEPNKGLDGIRIVLPKAATIVGRVTTPQGKPISPYAFVQTTPPDADRHLPAEGGGTNAWARVKWDGSYKLTNLAPGTYTLHLIVDGEVVDKVKVTVKEGETVEAPPLRLK